VRRQLNIEQTRQLAQDKLTPEHYRIYELHINNGQDDTLHLLTINKTAQTVGKSASQVFRILRTIREIMQGALDALTVAEIVYSPPYPAEDELRANFAIAIKRGHEPYDVIDRTCMAALSPMIKREHRRSEQRRQAA
jgi:hypothetical protein